MLVRSPRSGSVSLVVAWSARSLEWNKWSTVGKLRGGA